ncbi:MAG: DegT/DnrJ/EryC1/StrS family aminotransferase [Thaumarchaeota archaeon]|nr:DegT/DnrJ/EryC1/StrS family aminotransferase [Nitrososphaerota archaeon]
MNIPINMPVLGREEMREVGRVLRGGALTNASMEGGPNVREFEEAARRFLGSSYAVAVNSGTAAIQAALHALGISKGDEVLVPSFTFVATANAVVAAGARPVFVDIDKRYTMDPEDLEKKISRRSKAVIPVHLYGNVARVKEICRVADERGLMVIEDAAQSMGSTYRKKQSGTFGDMGCFSLYPAKVVTAGEGGLVVTDSKDLYDELRLVRNHGMMRGYDSRTFGLNLRMPEINAAIAKVQMRRLPSFLDRRRTNASMLSGLLRGMNVTIPEQRDHEEVNWYLYTVSTEKQSELKEALNAAGFGASVYYPIPVHRIPFYAAMKGSCKKLPVTEQAAGRVLSLPVHPGVRHNHLKKMGTIVGKIV